MFLLVWLRWLRGTVTFLITGAFPEKLINRCIRYHLPVWGVVRESDGLIAHTYARRYRMLHGLSRGTGTRTRIQKKSGLPFVIRRYRRRWGLVSGGIGAVLLLVFLSTRIWVVEVTGCVQIQPQEIIAQLSALGLRPGVAASQVDSRLLQRQMMLLDGRLAWIAVNLVGSTAQVEIREQTAVPKQQDFGDRAANVVAACDGQIRYMEVYEGQPLVQVGDTVSRGEVIISGIIEDQYGNTRTAYARALVIAQVCEEKTVEVPLTQLRWTRQGDPVERRYLSVFDLEIPLFLPGRNTAAAYSVSRSRQTLLDRPVISLVRESRTPVALEAVHLTEDQAREAAFSQMERLREGVDILSILSREESFTQQEGICRLTERWIVEKDIAQEAEIFLN